VPVERHLHQRDVLHANLCGTVVEIVKVSEHLCFVDDSVLPTIELAISILHDMISSLQWGYIHDLLFELAISFP
jgi:uncharacterized metal-binding protein